MTYTWGTLKSECKNLGFEKTTAYQKNPAFFIECANRALNLIATTVKPIYGKYVISHNPLNNLLPSPLYNMDIVAYPGTPVYKASGVKSYYFECDGTGTATISNGNETVVIEMESNRVFVPYKGFMEGDVSITFGGDYAYNVRNIAMYGEVYSDDPDDIPPYSQYVAYNIEELTAENGEKVFFEFADEKPILRGSFSSGDSYRVLEDYKKEQGKIILLNRFDVGQIEITYKKYPKQITAATPDDYALDIDYSAVHLVSLVMAYYLWRDDNFKRAQSYWNDFVDQKNDLLGVSNTDSSVATYVNTTGWW